MAAGSLPSSFGKSGFDRVRVFAFIERKIRMYYAPVRPHLRMVSLQVGWKFTVSTVPNMQIKIHK
jgi:hypothetical protein